MRTEALSQSQRRAELSLLERMRERKPAGSAGRSTGMTVDRTKSLAQLVEAGEEIGWDGPSDRYEFKSSLVTRCEALYSVPLGDYTVENLRLLISQDIALPWLVPLALEQLACNPVVEGDYHLRDLLESVLRCWNDAPCWGFWEDSPALRRQFAEIVSKIPSEWDGAEDPEWPGDLPELLAQFRASIHQ
jgi:hypothetical protein